MAVSSGAPGRGNARAVIVAERAIRAGQKPGRPSGTARVAVDQEDVAQLRFAAASKVAEETHAAAAEYVYVTAGEGEVVVDGDRYPVARATAVYIPPGARHGFVVASGGDLEAIQFFARTRQKESGR